MWSGRARRPFGGRGRQILPRKILDQMESTRGRLQEFTGIEIVSPPFLRIVVFHRRGGFDAFVGPFTIAISYYVKYISGLHFGAPHRILALCEEELPYAGSDQGQTIQLQLCSHFRESLPGSPLANWAQEGLGKCLSGADHELGPLNRKMRASLARGATFGTRLFEIGQPELLKQLRGFSDHKNFVKVMQFQAESWSVFEYLGGRDAPPERRDCLRAFLADREAQARPASLFERHFPYGLDRLVESWRKWVDDQGIGIHALPPSHIEEKLLSRVIPVVENRQAKLDDRIVAIRSMGFQGYAMGADALIGLLKSDDAIPTREVTWALESISGMVYGDDLDLWTAWWNALPAAIRQRRCRSNDVAALGP